MLLASLRRKIREEKPFKLHFLNADHDFAAGISVLRGTWAPECIWETEESL